jgi:hypothetical protein
LFPCNSLAGLVLSDTAAVFNNRVHVQFLLYFLNIVHYMGGCQYIALTTPGLTINPYS